MPAKRDLADEPPADMAALEAYAEGTSAELIRLALEVLGRGIATNRSGILPPQRCPPLAGDETRRGLAGGALSPSRERGRAGGGPPARRR